jgi:hypothetical protein
MVHSQFLEVLQVQKSGWQGIHRGPMVSFIDHWTYPPTHKPMNQHVLKQHSMDFN